MRGHAALNRVPFIFLRYTVLHRFVKWKENETEVLHISVEKF